MTTEFAGFQIDQGGVTFFVSESGTFNTSLTIPVYENDPTRGIRGEIYYNSTSGVVKYYNNVEWVPLAVSGVLPGPLSSISSLSTSGNEILYTIASNTYATSTITPAGRSFLTQSTAASQRSALGLVIGSDVQGHSTVLDSLVADASSSDNNIVYTIGGQYSTTPLQGWARLNLLTATSAADVRTTLELGNVATQSIAGGDIVSTTDNQTLSNKTINASSNTVSLTGADLDGFTITSTGSAANGDVFTISGGVAQWTTPAAGGDVVGPALSTDNGIARFDSTSGKLIQNSGVTISDGNAIAGLTGVTLSSGDINVGGGNISGVTNVTATGNVSGTWTGNTIPVERGGTGATSFTADNILVGGGTGAIQTLVPPSGSLVGTTANQTLTNKNISTATNTLTLDDTGGNINVVGGTEGQLLTVSGGDAVWSDPPGSVTSVGVPVIDNSLVKFSGTTGEDIQETGIIVDALNNMSGIGTIGSGSITSTGTVEGSTLTDGTMSSTSGVVSGATSIGTGSLTATGTVQGGTVTDGTLSTTAGAVTGATSIGTGSLTASGTVQGGTLTDGTLSTTAGAVTGATSIGTGSLTASGTVQGGTVTDGTLSSTAGAITGAISIGTVALTASGAVQGGTVTDGTFSTTAGAVSGITSLTASGTVTGGTLTDGTLSSTGGAITGATSIATTDLTTTGTVNLNGGATIPTGFDLTLTDVPVNATDAANKAYVDASAQGLQPIQPADLATTAPLPNTPAYAHPAETLTSVGGPGSLTVDGVIVSVGQRILVKNQADNRENGMYDVTDDGASPGPNWVLTRSADFNQAATPVLQGTFIFVEANGATINDLTQWVLNSAVTTISPLTDSVVFFQFGAGQSISAGSGLVQTLNAFDVGSSSTIYSTSTETRVNSTATANQILLSSGTVNTQATWGSLPLGDTNAVSGTLSVANGGTGAATLATGNFLQGNGTGAVTAVKAVPNGVVVGTTDTQELTGKTMTSNTNNVIARELWVGTGTGSVSTYAATAPTAGQVLTATTATTATWQDPGAGDVTGPVSSTNDAVVRFDGTTGSLLQDSSVTISDLGAVGGVSDLTATGTVQGGTLTDGTLSSTGGAVTGATNITASGTVQGLAITDGVLTSTLGAVTGATNITASGTVQGGTLTDGTLSMNGGALTGAVSVTASGTVQGGTLTDGTLSSTLGAVTGATNITASGTIEGGTLTDGTLSANAGAITGASSIASTSITDGVATLTGGNLTGAGSVSATTLTDGTATINLGSITSATWNGNTISVARGGTGATSLATGNFLQGNGTGAVTAVKAAPNGVVVGTTDTQTLTGKTLSTSTVIETNNTSFRDSANVNSLSLNTTALTTGQTITIPDLSGTVTLTTPTQTLTNKTMTSNTNNLIARELWIGTGTGSVSTYAATAPTTGQVLTATSATTATWQTPGAGSGFAPDRTLFVYPSAGGVSPNFPTLEAALTEASSLTPTSANPVQIQIFPGTYLEANPLSVPSHVSITSNSYHNSATIKATTVNPVLSLGGNCIIDGLQIDGNINGTTFATYGILSTAGTVGTTDRIFGVKVKNCTTALVSINGNGPSHSRNAVISNCYLEVDIAAVTCVSGLEATSGAVIETSFIEIESEGGATLTNGVRVTDDFSDIEMTGMHIEGVVNGVVVGTGVTSNVQTDYAKVRLDTGHIEDFSGIAIWMREKSVARLASLSVKDGTGTFPNQIHLLSDNPALPADSNFLVGLWTNLRFDLTAQGGALDNPLDLRGSNLSETPGEIASQISGELSVGLPGNGAEFVAGEGDSHTQFMTIFTFNASGGVFTDRTDDAKLLDGVTFNAFDQIAVDGDILYIGGSLQQFLGIKLQLTTPIALGAGTVQDTIDWQYWNGAAWVTLPFMVTASGEPYNIQGDTSFGAGDVIVGSKGYQYRFGDIRGDWATTTVNGQLKYWVRAVVLVSANISTIPVIDKIKLHTNRTEINADGFIEYFGNARPRSCETFPMSAFFSTDLTLAATATMEPAAGMSFTIPNCTFANATDTAIGYVWYPSPDLDTSYPLELVLTMTKTVQTGNVLWEVLYHYTQNEDPIGGTNGGGAPSAVPKSVTAAATVSSTNRAQSQATIVLPVTDLQASTDVVWFEIIRRGNDAADTYSNTVYLAGVKMCWTTWCEGGHLDLV